MSLSLKSAMNGVWRCQPFASRLSGFMPPQINAFAQISGSTCAATGNWSPATKIGDQ